MLIDRPDLFPAYIQKSARSRVPTHDGSIKRHADNGILGALENGGQAGVACSPGLAFDGEADRAQGRCCG